MPPKKSLKIKKTKKTKKPTRDQTINFGETIRKMIKKEIHKNAEDKQCYLTNSLNPYNGVITSADVIATMFPMPNMAQGTADDDRIGEKVKAKRFNIKGHFLTTISFASNSTYMRLGVRFMIVQPKTFGSQADIIANSTTWLAGLLQKGGTTSSFSGLIQDLYAPINTDLITVYHDKLYYIQTPYYQTAVGELTGINICKFFNINLKVKGKTLKYDANVGSDLLPVDYNPVMLIGYSKLDGGAADTVNTAISLASVSTLTYEDS